MMMNEIVEKMDFVSNLTEKLSDINNKISELQQWLTTNRNNCGIHHLTSDHKQQLNKIQETLTMINSTYCNSNSNNSYKVQCAKCDLEFNLRDSNDCLELENHQHVVDGLTFMKKNRQSDFTIQQLSSKKNQYRCLLCSFPFNGGKSIRSHVRSRTHKKKTDNRVLCERLATFLGHFDRLPEPYKVFVTIFDPFLDSNADSGVCNVCGELVLIESIPEHIARDKTHKFRFSMYDYSHLDGYEQMRQLTIENTENMSEVTLPADKNKHNINPSYPDIINGEKMSVTDFIPNRLKNHTKYINVDGEGGPVCLLCNYVIKHSSKIVAHLVSEGHKQKCRLEFQNNIAYYYYCCLCCKYFRTEPKWLEHMHSSVHKQKENAMTKQAVHAIYKEYECSNCYLVWFGQRHSINAHKRNKFGPNDKRWKQKDITLPNELAKLLKNETALEADIAKASKESLDVLCSIDSANKCCRAIEEALAPWFGEQIKAYPFGSRVSGLGNIASDLDVFVDIGSMYEGTINQNAEFQSKCVQKSAWALRRHKDFTDICPIPQARTPIVQVFHKITDLDCDLSFRHGLSIENTHFLKFCINIQPKLKSLILFLKKWIRLNKFRDRISTYGVSLMSIYMMQNKGYLPSLAKLRQLDPQKSKIIAGWETFRFEKPLSELQTLYPAYTPNERQLLAEFFDFYIKFDFEYRVICPLLGKPVLKRHFQEDNTATTSELPEEMINYVNKLRENPEDQEKIKITKSICLQDPFDLSHNVTKALPIEVLAKMLILMKQSHQFLIK